MCVRADCWRQRHTPLSTAVEMRWTFTGSLELPSLRTCLGHHTSPPHLKNTEKIVLPVEKKVQFQSTILVHINREAVESILTGNITNWHGLRTTQDGKALQRVTEHIRTSLLLIYRPSVRSVKWDVCTESQQYYKTTPTPATVCPPCCHLDKRHRSIHWHSIMWQEQLFSFLLWDCWPHPRQHLTYR